MKKILLFGASGLVGSRIAQLLGSRHEIVSPTRTQVNLENYRLVDQVIEKSKASEIIYAAGLTKADQAEAHPEKAYLLNAEVPKHIARAAAFQNTRFMYISTDAVFDGERDDRPYKEEDKPNPISVYGKSKLLGELYTLRASKRNAVIRIIMPYTYFFPRKLDLVRFALAELKKGNRLPGIIDQIINPIFVDDAVCAIEKILDTKVGGVFHLGALNYMSNFDFLVQITRTFGMNENLIYPVLFDEFFKDKKAKRTRYCWLDTNKFREKFGKSCLHTIGESLSLFKAQLSE